MMRGVASTMEKHHKVQILDEALEAAVKLSHRYIPARQLPDKSVSLLDTACARVAVSLHATPAEVDDSRKRIEALETELAIIGREKRDRHRHRQARRRTRTPCWREEREPAGRRWKQRWNDERALVDELLALRAKLRDGAQPVEGTGSNGLVDRQPQVARVDHEVVAARPRPTAPGASPPAARAARRARRPSRAPGAGEVLPAAAGRRRDGAHRVEDPAARRRCRARRPRGARGPVAGSSRSRRGRRRTCSPAPLVTEAYAWSTRASATSRSVQSASSATLLVERHGERVDVVRRDPGLVGVHGLRRDQRPPWLVMTEATSAVRTAVSASRSASSTSRTTPDAKPHAPRCTTRTARPRSSDSPAPWRLAVADVEVLRSGSVRAGSRRARRRGPGPGRGPRGRAGGRGAPRNPGSISCIPTEPYRRPSGASVLLLRLEEAGASPIQVAGSTSKPAERTASITIGVVVDDDLHRARSRPAGAARRPSSRRPAGSRCGVAGAAVPRGGRGARTTARCRGGVTPGAPTGRRRRRPRRVVARCRARPSSGGSCRAAAEERVPVLGALLEVVEPVPDVGQHAVDVDDGEGRGRRRSVMRRAYAPRSSTRSGPFATWTWVGIRVRSSVTWLTTPTVRPPARSASMRSITSSSVSGSSIPKPSSTNRVSTRSAARLVGHDVGEPESQGEGHDERLAAGEGRGVAGLAGPGVEHLEAEARSRRRRAPCRSRRSE